MTNGQTIPDAITTHGHIVDEFGHTVAWRDGDCIVVQRHIHEPSDRREIVRELIQAGWTAREETPDVIVWLSPDAGTATGDEDAPGQ